MRRLRSSSSARSRASAIGSRETLLYRSDEWRVKTLAANADVAAIVYAPRPTFNPWFIWKALLAAHQAGIPAVVIRNKTDLAGPPAAVTFPGPARPAVRIPERTARAKW